MTAPLGTETLMTLGRQADIDTVAAAFSEIPYYNDGLALSNPLNDDPELGTSRDNSRDPTDPAPSIRRGAGSMTFMLDLSVVHHLLYGIFGAPASVDDTGDWTHTFQSGANPLPFYSFENKWKDSAPKRYKYSRGVSMNGFSIGINPQDGYRQITVPMLAADVKPQETASVSGSPAAVPTSRLRVPATVGTLLLGADEGSLAAAGEVIGGTVDFNNNNRERVFAGSGGIGDFEAGRPAAGANVRIRGDNVTAAGLADNQNTAFAAAVLYQLSATQLLQVTFPRVFAPEPSVVVDGPDGIEFDMNIMGSQTVASGSERPMCEVVLKSQTADTAL